MEICKNTKNLKILKIENITEYEHLRINNSENGVNVKFWKSEKLNF